MIPGESKLRWLWRAPARALARLRDFYVRTLTGCARYVPADAAFGALPLPRSQSCAGASAVGSDWSGVGEEDLRELIRASSQRRDDQQRQVVEAVARSQSTAVARSMAPIDEDAPCEFGAGVGIRRSHCHRKEAVYSSAPRV